jgi:hypothetical protein
VSVADPGWPVSRARRTVRPTGDARGRVGCASPTDPGAAMLGRLFPLAVALVLLGPGASVASACDCIRLRPLSPAVRREAPVIFVGRVVEIVERSEHTTRTYDGGATGETRPLDRFVWFVVERGWAGVTQPRTRVHADMDDCQFPFVIGQRYVVFAQADPRGGVATSHCTRTAAIEQADTTLRALGAPAYVAPVSTSPRR